MSGHGFQLSTVVVGDSADAWSAAGFAVDDGVVRIGNTVVVCDPDAGRGVASVSVDGIDAPVDGLMFAPTPVSLPPPRPHANGVEAFDHLVVMSGGVERTSRAFADAGLEKRRTRRFEAGGQTRRQDFFWLGDVILELVGLDDSTDGEARFWGLALVCGDLDATANELGDALGTVKDAVQPGRRIATLRTRELGIGVPIALMSHHASG